MSSKKMIKTRVMIVKLVLVNLLMQVIKLSDTLNMCVNELYLSQ